MWEMYVRLRYSVSQIGEKTIFFHYSNEPCHFFLMNPVRGVGRSHYYFKIWSTFIKYISKTYLKSSGGFHIMLLPVRRTHICFVRVQVRARLACACLPNICPAFCTRALLMRTPSVHAPGLKNVPKYDSIELGWAGPAVISATGSSKQVQTSWIPPLQEERPFKQLLIF